MNSHGDDCVVIIADQKDIKMGEMFNNKVDGAIDTLKCYLSHIQDKFDDGDMDGARVYIMDALKFANSFCGESSDFLNQAKIKLETLKDLMRKIA
jgi:hypothetical protein